MYIDNNNITVNEMQVISEFFNVHCDGDRQDLIIDGVKQ